MSVAKGWQVATAARIEILENTYIASFSERTQYKAIMIFFEKGWLQ